jgi:hypothetical protein
MAMGLGEALKKYFGTGTSKASSATTNLMTLRRKLEAAMLKGDDAAAAKIQKQIEVIRTQSTQTPSM